MDLIKKHLTTGQYLTQEYEKRSIFLHHTLSTNAMSAWRWWNSTPSRVGTPYIIDRDGTIIECFDPKMWAFHLGVPGDDNWQEKHSINIELVSAGGLFYENGEYRFYPLWPNKLRYTIIPPEEVIGMDGYGGHDFWHDYTEDQMESLKWLIGRLALDFPSLVVENDLDGFWKYDYSVIKDHKPGIWAHSTVRENKFDVIPTPIIISSLKGVQGELTNIRKATEIPEVTVKAKKKTNNKTKKSRK